MAGPRLDDVVALSANLYLSVLYQIGEQVDSNVSIGNLVFYLTAC